MFGTAKVTHRLSKMSGDLVIDSEQPELLERPSPDSCANDPLFG